jgi:hypothetical protein
LALSEPFRYGVGRIRCVSLGSGESFRFRPRRREMSKEKARSRAQTKSVHLAAFLMASVAAPSLARAAEPPVAIGEIGTRVSRGDVDLRAVVRGALEREIKTIVLETRGKRYVLSASLVRLDAGKQPGAGRIEGMISVVLREAKSGAIRAIVEGKSRAEGQPGADLDLAVVEAAVRAAVAALPEAVR